MPKDIGNGQVLADFSKGKDPVDELQKVMGLVDLSNRLKMAPVEQAIKEADAKLKQADVESIEFIKQKRQWDFLHAKNQELREKADYFFNGAKSLPQLFLLSPQVGAIKAQELGFTTTVGSGAEGKPDGTFVLSRQDDKGNVSSFSINPRGISDPEKIASNEAGLRGEWEKYAKQTGWTDLDPNFHAIERVWTMPGGINDLSMVISYAKIKDPNSVVRTSEGEAIANTTNLPGFFQQILAKQSDPKAPKLTPEQREMIYQDAKKHYDFVRDNMIARGKSYAELAPGLGGNAKNVIIPIGSLKPEDIFGKPETAPPPPGPMNTGGKGQQAAPAPTEAGIIPVPKEEKQRKIGDQIIYKNTNDLLRNKLFPSIR